MAIFEYQALDGRGHKRKGVIESDSPRLARQSLREQGLSPIALEVMAARHQVTSKGLFGGRRLSLRHLALATRQLATLLHSGMPLEQTLSVISSQTDNKQLRRMLLGLRSKVLEGQSLAIACGQFPNAFPPLYRATVAAGESSGKLDRVLERLAEHLENREQIQQKVQLALIYPVVLTVISLLVIIALLTYVVPEIVGVFENLGQELPALTTGLIATSEFVQNYGLYVLLGILLVWIGSRLLLRIEKFRFRLHRFLLRLPLIGRFSRTANSARFTRTLAILTGSGVELLEALKISSQVIPNLAMKAAVDQAAIKVREGTSLSSALDQSKLFSPIAVHLIASGESSGKLDQMLASAADNQEREIQSLTDLIVGIFEPALILVMGSVVLVIVLAILQPIFDMNQLVK